MYKLLALLVMIALVSSEFVHEGCIFPGEWYDMKIDPVYTHNPREYKPVGYHLVGFVHGTDTSNRYGLGRIMAPNYWCYSVVKDYMWKWRSGTGSEYQSMWDLTIETDAIVNNHHDWQLYCDIAAVYSMLPMAIDIPLPGAPPNHRPILLLRGRYMVGGRTHFEQLVHEATAHLIYGPNYVPVSDTALIPVRSKSHAITQSNDFYSFLRVQAVDAMVLWQKLSQLRSELIQDIDQAFRWSRTRFDTVKAEMTCLYGYNLVAASLGKPERCTPLLIETTDSSGWWIMESKADLEYAMIINDWLHTGIGRDLISPFMWMPTFGVYFCSWSGWRNRSDKEMMVVGRLLYADTKWADLARKECWQNRLLLGRCREEWYGSSPTSGRLSSPSR